MEVLRIILKTNFKPPDSKILIGPQHEVVIVTISFIKAQFFSVVEDR